MGNKDFQEKLYDLNHVHHEHIKKVNAFFFINYKGIINPIFNFTIIVFIKLSFRRLTFRGF